MDNIKQNQLLTFLSKKLLLVHKLYLGIFLKKASDESFQDIMTLPYKSVTVTALLGCFLGVFGASRFYLGDYIFGTIKVISSLLLIPSLALIRYLMNLLHATGDPGVIIVMVFLLLLGVAFIGAYIFWYIADIVATLKLCKNKNYQMIMKKLEMPLSNNIIK